MANDLFKAARDGDEARARQLLENEAADVHEKNEDQLTPLLIAAKRGHRDVTRLLLQHDADIEASDEDGNTALHLATKAKRTNIVRLLLQHNAEVDACDDSGRTALHLAARTGDLVIARLLVKKNIDVDAIDDSGNTAMMVAERAGHQRIVDLLKDNWDGDGETAWSDPESESRSSAGKSRFTSATTSGGPRAGHSGPGARGNTKPSTSAPAPAPGGDSVQLWGSATGKEFARGAKRFAISSASGYVAVAFSNYTIKLIEVKTGKVYKMLAIAVGSSINEIVGLSFSGDGQQLVLATWHSQGDGSRIQLWNVKLGARMMCIHVPNSFIYSLAISHDGKYFATAHKDDTVHVWKRDTGTCIKTHSTKHSITGWGSVVTFSPDGNLLAAGVEYGQIFLWEPSTGALVNKFESPAGRITAISFSPGNDLLATATSDGKVWLRKSAWGAIRNCLDGPATAVLSIGFSPDGQLLACPVRDGGIGIWNIKTESFLNIPRDSESNTVIGVAFSSDGEILASMTANGTIMPWWPGSENTAKTEETGKTFGRR